MPLPSPSMLQSSTLAPIWSTLIDTLRIDVFLYREPVAVVSTSNKFLNELLRKGGPSA